MPNWCMNSVKIVGDLQVMSSLFDTIKEKGEFLNVICPLPPFEDDSSAYETTISQWGTKWDVDTCFLNFEVNENGDGVIFGSFESAWSPPIEALASFESNDAVDSVDLKYFEPGMMFCGWYTKGEDFCMDIQSTNEEWVIENVPEEIVEEFDLLETFDEWQQEYDEEFGSDTLALEYKPDEEPSEDPSEDAT